MKKAGMSIRDIRQYIELALRGDDTIDTRLKMFTHQRDVLLAQMEEMRHTLETVEYKCWYYETAKAAGTIDVPRDMADEDVPERFRAITIMLGLSVHVFAASTSQGIWRTRTCPSASAPSGANSRRFRRSKGKLLFCRQAGKG